MIEFWAVYLCQVFEQFGVTVTSLLDMPNQDMQLDGSYKEAMSRLYAFDLIEQHKHIFLNQDLKDRLWLLRTQLKNGEPFTVAMFARELQGMLGQMKMSLSARKFAYVAPPNDEYFEKEKLWGAEVYEKFPDARADIKDAGNAFSASLHTACVFHTVRASEHGLRKLAKRLRVTIADKNTLIPLEYGEWDKVITGVNAKISAARALPKTSKRQRSLERFSDAGQHCLFVKDIWRNTVSHARRAYTQNEALSAMERVRDFLQFLAKGLA